MVSVLDGLHSSKYPVTEEMRAAWDARAKENAEYYVANSNTSWDSRDFFRTGEISVANEIMPDMQVICGGGGRSPYDMSMVEIGCGVGRMTKALSRIFGHVTAVDVSSEMIKRARVNLAGVDNVSFLLGDGQTLTDLADSSQDFAFSYIVFQHIPRLEVISSYCSEVCRVLKPGSLFKLQVQGAIFERASEPDTWLGVSVSEVDAERLARENGFTLERSGGAGTQLFWLYFRKLN